MYSFDHPTFAFCFYSMVKYLFHFTNLLLSCYSLILSAWSDNRDCTVRVQKEMMAIKYHTFYSKYGSDIKIFTSKPSRTGFINQHTLYLTRIEGYTEQDIYIFFVYNGTSVPWKISVNNFQLSTMS